jgi:hypothetical protein
MPNGLADIFISNSRNEPRRLGVAINRVRSKYFFSIGSIFTLLATVLISNTPANSWSSDTVAATIAGGTGADAGLSMAVDRSGNFYTVGYFSNTVDFDPNSSTLNLTSSGLKDIFITKLNSEGNLVWAKKIGGTSDDQAQKVTVDGNGDVYLAGDFSGTVDFDPGSGTQNLTASGSTDAFLLKLNSTGEFIWAKKFGGTNTDIAYSVATDSSNNVLLVGSFKDTVDFDPSGATFNLVSTLSTGGSPAPTDDIFIVKLNSSGDFSWAKSIGGTNSDIAYSVLVDSSDNILVSGSFRGTNVDFDPGAGTSTLSAQANGRSHAFVMKLNNLGEFVWAKDMGGLLGSRSNSMAIDSDNNIYTTGYFEGTVDFDPGAGTANLTASGVSDAFFDLFVSKINSNGEYLWAKAIGGATGSDEGVGISTDSTGNVYTVGYFSESVDFDPGAGTTTLSSNGSNDNFVLKLNSSGAFVWAKSFGGSSDDLATEITADTSGNVFTSGYFQGTVDFNPNSGTSNLTSSGVQDIFNLRLDSSGDALYATAPSAPTIN